MLGSVGIHRRVKSVPEHGDEPVAVADAVDRLGPRRAALRGVVLRPAVDVVERQVVVDRDLVELRDRQIRLEVVGLARDPRIRRDRRRSQSAGDSAFCGSITRAWLSTCLNCSPSGWNVLPPSSETIMYVSTRIDAVEDVRAGDEFLIVLGTDALVAALLRPGLAAVRRLETAALIFGRFDQRIDHVGLDRRNGQSDAAQVRTRQAARDLPPGLARRRSTCRSPTPARR